MHPCEIVEGYDEIIQFTDEFLHKREVDSFSVEEE